MRPQKEEGVFDASMFNAELRSSESSEVRAWGNRQRNLEIVYREMLEELEDIEDLKALEEMRSKPLKFRKLEDFLNEYMPEV